MSPDLKAALKQVEIVAPTESTVLILGETGAGKELIARVIYSISSQSSRAFEIPPELTGATLKVSLGCFIELLAEAKCFDQRYENLGQVRWLVGNAWRFDDTTAYYRSSN
jgi:transcriptional regulator of aromatic amino acid metabolism